MEYEKQGLCSGVDHERLLKEEEEEAKKKHCGNLGFTLEVDFRFNMHYKNIVNKESWRLSLETLNISRILTLQSGYIVTLGGRCGRSETTLYTNNLIYYIK